MGFTKKKGEGPGEKAKHPRIQKCTLKAMPPRKIQKVNQKTGWESGGIQRDPHRMQ